MAFRVTFLGAAETVTGSNFLVEGEQGSLLVDCGLEQGKDFCEADMYAPFTFDVPAIDALIITHAHLDHIGRAPKLMREGFAGKVYMTAPTKDLMELMLRDSARIMAGDAQRKGIPVMFDDNDIDALLQRVEIIGFHQEWEAAPGLSCYLRQTGHILGSASVRIKDHDTAIGFTGDIGNSPNPLLPDAEPITDADVIVTESVYGDRPNPGKEHRVEELKNAVKRAIERGGAILMPAFSIERTQVLLYELSNLMDAGELPRIPVFLDSPLAIKATAVYEKWDETFFKKSAVEELHREKSLFTFPFLTMTESKEDSEKIAHAPNPKIIMAGAGMSHGGRIGRWEQRYLPDPTTTLFIVGYQSPGSPGRLLQDGAKNVRIDRQDVRVRATIETYHGWSGHADRDGLLEFAESCQPRAKSFFVVMGEPASARFLAQRIHDFIGARAVVPRQGETWKVEGSRITKI